jgi:hypothetical protein
VKCAESMSPAGTFSQFQGKDEAQAGQGLAVTY